MLVFKLIEYWTVTKQLAGQATAFLENEIP